MRTLLVTGGAGFIGSNFVRFWRRRHPEDRIIVLDLLTYAGVFASVEDVIDGRQVWFFRGDIGDVPLVESLLERHDVTHIVHFAAESHVDRSIDGPDVFLETNVIGTHALLKAARAVWRPGALDAGRRFHHVSTDEVYGALGPDDPPFSETTPYAPSSPYSASKAAADHLVRAYHHTYGLPITTSNCSNNYGPYQFPEKLIPLMVVRMLTGGELPVYGDGSNRRDWLFVADHCEGVARVLERGRVGQTYAFGGHGERSNLELVEELALIVDGRMARSPELRARFPNAPAACGARSRDLLRFVTDRPGHDWRYAIDSSKAASQLGWRPGHSLSDALAATVDWYAANEAWWGPLVR